MTQQDVMTSDHAWLDDGDESEVVAACQRALLEMVDLGVPLASIYLQAGTSLRCHAIHGYRQLFDGIGPEVGVIGQVWRCGTTAEVATDDNRYRAAVGRVRQEICVPVLSSGTCVGVLNAETTEAFVPGLARRLEALADRLGAEIATLPPAVLSPAQRLLTHAALIATSQDAAELSQGVLAAAEDVSGMASGMVLLGKPLSCTAIRGPLGPALARIAPEALRELDAWVQHGGSSRTAPHLDGHDFLGQQALREAGALSHVVVAIGSGEDRLGSLVLAADAQIAVTRPTVESLELLGALSGAHFRTTSAIDVLREAATTDALTGLGNRIAFDRSLDRQRRAGGEVTVAVVLVDLDGFKRVNDTMGHPAGDALLVEAASALSACLRAGDALFRLGGDEFATVVRVRSEAELDDICRRLVEGYRQLTGHTLSAGAVIARLDEPLTEVVERADRALYASKRCGRDRHTLV